MNEGPPPDEPRALNDPVDDHATPLTFEEQRDLIPAYISTRAELNAQEQREILAETRRLRRRPPASSQILTVEWLLATHRKLFAQTWRWAGKIRTSPRNLGVPHWEIRARLTEAVADARFWVEHGSYEPDEVAVRLHHRLVAIHCFANGNGRHARLVADVLFAAARAPTILLGGKHPGRRGQRAKPVYRGAAGGGQR